MHLSKYQNMAMNMKPSIRFILETYMYNLNFKFEFSGVIHMRFSYKKDNSLKGSWKSLMK